VVISLAASNTTPETQTSPTSPTDSSPFLQPLHLLLKPAANSTANPNIGNKTVCSRNSISRNFKIWQVETTEIPVKVTNTSDFAWDSKGANPVNFSYRWLDPNGKVVVLDGERTGLAKNFSSTENLR